MLNPFLWPGPEFLGFYVALGVVTWLTLRHVIQRGEARPAPLLLADPYEIAYLRGGLNEALRVAAVALVDRKLLTENGETLVAAEGASEQADAPIEQEILDFFVKPVAAAEMFGAHRFAAVEAALRDKLERAGVLAGEAVMDR